jgi:hypothetical protein
VGRLAAGIGEKNPRKIFTENTMGIRYYIVNTGRFKSNTVGILRYFLGINTDGITHGIRVFWLHFEFLFEFVAICMYLDTKQF